MFFGLQWIDISASWSFVALAIGMLKILFMIAMEMWTILPGLPELLCPDRPEGVNMREKEQNASFGRYLLKQLGTEQSKVKLEEAVDLLNHEVVVNVTRAVVSLQPAFVAYRRGMRDAAKNWKKTKSDEGGLL